MNKKLLFSLLAFSLFLTTTTALGQVLTDIKMSNGIDSTGTCGADFTDSGGAAGNYGNNESFTLTICSDSLNKTHIALGFEQIDLDPLDELCFFDGDNVNAPPLGCSSDFGRSQNAIIETTARNPRGCLTIRFRSNGSGTRSGWLAHILCIASCQTVQAKIESTLPLTMPADTGWIDGCPNQTRVAFKGKGIYPYNDVAYHQSDALSKFEWNFGDGSPIGYGPEVSHVYTQAGGYIVQLVVTDTMGCKNINYIKQRVRISPRPTFSTGYVPAQICTGTTLLLRGQTGRLDTSYQVSTRPNSASFPLGQVHSETLFIPDKQGEQYKTSVYFSDFAPGQKLTNINDLLRIFVKMEHSYARDLEIKIVCPSKKEVVMHKYGGVGNTLMIGVPNCTDDRTPANVNNPALNPAGTGLIYAWTPTATNGTWRSNTGTNGTSNTCQNSPGFNLPPGNYKSEDPLDGGLLSLFRGGLIGCPLNGEWSLIIKDQIGRDNGWIFEWGIDFAASLYPAIETFTRTIPDHKWLNNSNISMYSPDSIISKPRNAGTASFVYQVTDNVGCVFDTTVNVNVLPSTHLTCQTCTPDFPKLRDTSICAVDAGVLLNKTARQPINNSIVFESFPNRVIDAVSATLAKPDTSTILVRNMFQNTITTPLNQIDSVCFDIGSRVSDDIFVQLLAPNNTKIPLMNTRRGGFVFPLRNVCFSPSATRAISAASAPITGLYQPENGVASWNVFNGSPVNGNWKLLVSDSRGTEKDTINQWSITFKSGNALSYNWTTATGLSCVNCATPVAKPPVTTRYIVTIIDSTACPPHKDTVNVAISDSMPAPAELPGTVTFTSVQFAWAAVAGATGYEVSVNGNAWILPNGTLSHRIAGLRTGQVVDLRVRAIGARCGSQVKALTLTTQACIATIGNPKRLEIDSVLCYGSASPLVNFRYATGQAPFTYIIDGFTQNSSAVFLDKIKAGAHRAIFIDGTGCSDTLDFHFGQPDSINFRVTADSVKCFGGNNGKLTALASGGTGQLTYSLNLNPNRRNIGTFDTLTAGVYNIEVQDVNRCRKSTNADVFQPTPLSIKLTKNDVRCFGAATGSVKATVVGGIPAYDYTWRSGQSGQTKDTITNVAAGTYFVTLTDRNGCTKSDSIQVASNPKIVLSTTQDSVTCFGATTGKARGRATGGLAPFFYKWNNNQVDSTATGLRIGTYRVTATDALGCFDTASVVVLQPDSLRFDSLVVLPASCSNTATGSARVVVNGGTKSYIYGWSNGATTPSITSLAAGFFGLTVTDMKGCQKSQNLTVGAAPPLVLDRFDELKVQCNGTATGGLVAKVSGGSGSYGFRWNTTPNQLTDTAKTLRAGAYQVTITDRNNCQIVKDTTIGEPTKLIANITQFTNVSCRGKSDGTATPSVFGGTGLPGNNRYLFKWSDPLNQNALIADSLAAGNYIVTVTDANGCTDTANVTITQPVSAVTSTTLQTRLACFGQNTGEGRVIPSGGNGNYKYRWSNLQSAATVTNLTKGKYYVTVTDIKGCAHADSLEAFTHDSIIATFALAQPRCYNTATGSMNITSVVGGAGNGTMSNYFFRWSTSPVQTTPQAVNVFGNRAYSVTITDNENCSNVAYTYLIQPGPINLSSNIRNVSCFDGNDGEAQVNAFGTNNAFSFAWNDPRRQTTQRATQLTAGRYTVVVKDSSGCQKDTIINVAQPTRLKMDNITVVGNKCVGDSTGTIDISFSGGTPTYNYLWSNGANKSTLSKLRSGTYILTVSDANGCKQNDTVLIKSPPPVDADLVTMPVRCYADRNGVITINAFGGTTPYLYSLDGKNFNGISQIIGLKAGSFDVYVKDANGCVWFTRETVGSPPKFLIDATANATINLGDKIQLFANPQNAQGKVVLTWKQPYDSTLTCLKCQNPTASPKSTITYTVTGIDSAGCRAADSVKITVEKPRNIYVPTGFTPNKDNVNDKLIVHGRKGTSIDIFRVFDRWGELVYEARTFQVNDENAGWNGTFRGQDMMSGQFVWYIEATYIDGAKEVLKGHTTLIR